MLIGHVSDEYYAALPDVAVELRGARGQAQPPNWAPLPVR
jgi:hypothetical protein